VKGIIKARLAKIGCSRMVKSLEYLMEELLIFIGQVVSVMAWEITHRRTH
jgi:hypothetical protein